VDGWRLLPNPNQWQVTPETARLLHHWRHHEFNSFRPFYCQVEAVETAICVTEVAPHGFVYKRVPHVSHKSIANNAEFDVIWEKWQATLESLRIQLSNAFGQDGRM
jgi:hypothetical protein